MTTIAAASVNGTHALAADGLSVAGSLVVSESVEKLFVLSLPADLDGWPVVGVDGDLRTVNLVAALPSDHEVSPAGFAAQLKELYEAQGYPPQSGDDHAGGAPCWTQEAFRMDDSGIWWIGQDLSLTPVREGFPQALGSGMELAVGAMTLLDDEECALSARDLVVRAVRVAMKRDAGTGGKIMLATRGAENFGPEWI